MTEKEQAYEKLLNRVAGICETNQHVDFADDVGEEFKAISTQIMWGMWEIEQADKENALEKIRSLWDTCGEEPIYRNGLRSLRGR